MKTAAQTPASARRLPSHQLYLNEGLSTKKTAFIIVTVIGCIAILWPKVFHPMMFGSTAPKANLKEQRFPGGCCEVVLDREDFLNGTDVLELGPQLYRKHLNLFTGEASLRQERPAHLHPESIYQAMRERGRAIPATPTVPIVDRKASSSNSPPRIVEGRPGPIPGMRPPMGAGSIHQPQTKGSSMGFVMPLYTIGIVVFFVYTILKIVFKKSVPNPPYGPTPVNANFRKEVFGQESERHVEDLNGSKLVVTAIQGLIDAADEHLKIREKNLNDSESMKSAKNTNPKNGNISHGHTTEHNEEVSQVVKESEISEEYKKIEELHTGDLQKRKRKDGSADRSVAVLGIDVTASCEGGQKWTGRPPTPVFFSHNEHSKDVEIPEPKSIFLEGSLARDAQILVSDSETKTEEVYDPELNGSAEEPAVVLSSKMTLSLINLDTNHAYDNDTSNNDTESPLGDDIEIIGHDEK